MTALLPHHAGQGCFEQVQDTEVVELHGPLKNRDILLLKAACTAVLMVELKLMLMLVLVLARK